MNCTCIFFLEIFVEREPIEKSSRLDWSKLVHRAGCLSWKQISANGLATAHNCLASIRYESKAVPDIGQELSGDKNEAQDPFSGISDVVVERDY